MRIVDLHEYRPGQFQAVDSDGALVPKDELGQISAELDIEQSMLPRDVTLKLVPHSEAGYLRLVPTIKLQGEEVELSPQIQYSLGYVILGSMAYLLANGAILQALLEKMPGVLGNRLDLASCLNLMRIVRIDPDLPELDASALHNLALPASDTATVAAGLLPSVNPYPYQARGIDWLRERISYGLGGLLADEMGLGKTLQAIAAIAHVVAGGGRCLVVVPNALTENWRRELLKFAALESYSYVREGTNLSITALRRWAVVITTYDTVRSRELILGQDIWDLVVIDEAQYIKNSSAQRSQSTRNLKRRLSVALTGTPVENRPSDLVNILDFVVPGAFIDLMEAGDELSAAQASAVLTPYLPQLMLRRTVSEVGEHLPERHDVPVALAASDWYRAKHSSIVAEASSSNSRGARLAAITELRQLSGREPAETSPKLDFIKTLMESASPEREKIIIFASFNNSISMIQRNLRIQGLNVLAITGATNNRQEVVDRFAELHGPSALVMNPRAGGVGLNITTAPTVVHFEPEWNPATIDQASARSYRTGQGQTFIAYYLSIANSIEDYMLERVEEKREMAGQLITSVEEDLTDEQIMRLLSWLTQ